MNKALIFWFSGLSGAGKTTVACGVCCRLTRNGYDVQTLDGDDVRKHYHRHLGYSEADIKENNRLIAQLCEERRDSCTLSSPRGGMKPRSCRTLAM